MTPVMTCTCARGLLCDEARRLRHESTEAWQMYTSKPTALNLADWQQKDAAYKQHQAAAYGQRNAGMKKETTP